MRSTCLKTDKNIASLRWRQLLKRLSFARVQAFEEGLDIMFQFRIGCRIDGVGRVHSVITVPPMFGDGLPPNDLLRDFLTSRVTSVSQGQEERLWPKVSERQPQ